LTKFICVFSVCLVVAGCGGTETKTVTVDHAAAPPPKPTTTPAQHKTTDCDALGINAIRLKEGTCTQQRKTFTIVDRDSTLNLKELNVRLVNTSSTPTISNDTGVTRAKAGTFYIVTLEVTNKIDQPAAFDSSQGQVGLLTNGKSYSESFDAENNPGDSFTWNSDEIQPDATATGTVIFDLPPSAAKTVERDGNIVVLNFSDADSTDASTAGIIRTYH
jgi:hypothetical protein